jgi:hypothetical protein
VIGKLREDGTRRKREPEPKPLKDDAQREEEIEEGIETEDTDEKEDRGPKHVIKVIGFNSRKFDVNLFISHINSPKIKVIQVLGTSTQYKSLTLTHEDYPFGLQFIDLLLYLAGGTLEKNAKAFSKDVVKGVFPYELLTTTNYKEELKKEESFTHEQFYSSLNNSNISDKEYEQYLADAPNFPTRLDYCFTITNLIQKSYYQS